MSREHIFARCLVVGSLLTAGIGLLSYLLFDFEFYCDSEEGNSKSSEKHDRNSDAERRARQNKTMLNSHDEAIVEVCLSDITSAVSAIAGGTSSIELCANRSEGGVTPSIGLVEDVVRMARGKDIQVHVLIRPRPGNFVYSDVEFDIMVGDIVTAKNAGAHGVVVGILLESGDVDEDRMAVIRSVSAGMFLTFHRAFDITRDPRRALESVINLGCDRLLTSAQSSTADQGIFLFKELSSLAQNRILIIAASGINAENAFEIILKTRVDGVHAGSSVHAYYNAASTGCTDSTVVGLMETALTASSTRITLAVHTERSSSTQLSVIEESPILVSSVGNELDHEDEGRELPGLGGGYDCVSVDKVLELVALVNSAWTLRSSEKTDDDAETSQQVLALLPAPIG